MQDPRDLSHCVLYEIRGSVHVLHFPVQHPHENILHLSHCLHRILDEIQEAILHRKSFLNYPLFVLAFRLMTPWAMTSLIWRCSCHRLWSSHVSFNQGGPLGNWLGLSPFGSRPSLSCPRLSCSTKSESSRTLLPTTLLAWASIDFCTFWTGCTDGKPRGSCAGLKY